jgi:hypothetical protein
MEEQLKPYPLGLELTLEVHELGGTVSVDGFSGYEPEFNREITD